MAATCGDAGKRAGKVLARGLTCRVGLLPTAARWTRLEKAVP